MEIAKSANRYTAVSQRLQKRYNSGQKVELVYYSPGEALLWERKIVLGLGKE